MTVSLLAILFGCILSVSGGGTVQQVSKAVLTQRSHNDATRDAWELFSNHRLHTTRLPLSVASSKVTRKIEWSKRRILEISSLGGSWSRELQRLGSERITSNLFERAFVRC